MASEVLLQPGAAGIDAELREQYPTTNYGTAASMYVDRAATVTRKRTLVQFDLSSLSVTQGSRVLFAKLFLHPAQGPSGTYPLTIGAHRVTASWNESQVSWARRDASNTWASPGGDFDATLAGSSLISTGLRTSASTWHSFDVTQLVRDWLDGVSPNLGLLLKAEDDQAATTTMGFRSSDMSTATERPFLWIETTESPLNLFPVAAGTYQEWDPAGSDGIPNPEILTVPPAIAPGTEPVELWRRINSASYSNVRISFRTSGGVPAGAVISSVKLKAAVQPYGLGYSASGTLGIRTNGQDFWEASSHTITTYAELEAEWTSNPATGQAWTAADVNALEPMAKAGGGTRTFCLNRLYVQVAFTTGSSLSVADSGAAQDSPAAIISAAEAVGAQDAAARDQEGAGSWRESWLERRVYDPVTGRWHFERIPRWEWYPGVEGTLRPEAEAGTAADAASVVNQLVGPVTEEGAGTDALAGPPEVSFALGDAAVPVEGAGPHNEVSLGDANAGSAQESLAVELVPLAVSDAADPATEGFGQVVLAPDAPETGRGEDGVPEVVAGGIAVTDAGSGAEVAQRLTLLDRHILSCEIDATLEALADAATLELVESDPANPTSPVAQAWLQLTRGDLVRIRLGLAGVGLDDYGTFRLDQVSLTAGDNALRTSLSARDQAALLLDEVGASYAASFGVQPASTTGGTPTVYPSLESALQQTQPSYPSMVGIAGALAARVGLGLVWDAPSYALKDFAIGAEESTGAALGRLLEPLRASRHYRTDAWVEDGQLVVRERGRSPLAGTLDCHLGQVQSVRRSQMPFVGTVTVTGATTTQRIEYRSDGEKKHADTPSTSVEVSEEPDGDKVVRTYVSTAVDEYSWDSIKELASVETTHQEYEEVPGEDAHWLGRVLVSESVQLDYDLHTGQPKHERRERRYDYDAEWRLILSTECRKTYDSPLWKLAELRTTHYAQATPTDVRTTVNEWTLKEADGELHQRTGYPKSQVNPGTLQSGLQVVPNPDDAWDQNEDGSAPRQTRTFEITKQYQGSAYGGGSLPRSYSHGSLMSDGACADIASSIAGESGAWLYELALRWPRPLPYRKGARILLVHLPGGMPDTEALLTRVRTRFDAERSEWIHDLSFEAWSNQ